MLNWSGRIILLLAIALALAWFIREISIRVRIIRRGKHDVRRWDRPVERLAFMIGRVGAQLAVAQLEGGAEPGVRQVEHVLVGIHHRLVPEQPPMPFGSEAFWRWIGEETL